MARLQKQSLVAVAVALAIGSSGRVHGAEDALQEVTVTGSRITQSSGMNAPTPVTAVGAAELSQMSPGNVVDALSQLPQFFGNIGSEQIVGGQNSGGANVNLRGAGVNRTLVLLDGRRVVSSNRFGTVDVNMFPESLLKGIETVTGGASASYGTDAVAGVVNFLLDTDFEGLKLHGQGGETTRGDGGNWEASITAGHGFGEKLHVVGSLMATEQDPIKSFRSLEKRRYFNQASRVTNPNPSGPLEIILPYVTPTNFSNKGLIIEPAFPTLNRQEFQSDGTIRPFPMTGMGNINTGCQCFAENSQTYGVDSDTEVAPGYKRTNGFVHMSYDLTDNTNLYLQGLLGTTRTDDRRESISLLSVWQGRIYADNPYLAADTRAKMLAALPANRQYVGFGFFGLDTPDTPLGDTRQITDNRMKSGTIGMKTDFHSGFLDGWHMSAYYQYGENRQDFITRNGIRTDRLPLALDVVADANGRPVCRVSLPQFDPRGIFKDCVPVNLFGGLDNLSPQAVAWIRDDNKTARQWTDQHVGEIVLDGTLWEQGFFGAGPLAGAFGVSYRKDSLEQKTLEAGDEFPALPDGTLLSDLGVLPASLRGVVPQGENGGVPGYTGIPGLRFVPTGFKGDGNSSAVQFSSLRAIAGGYSVKEAFTELNIPVLKDVAFAKSLTFNTAARWASYSGSGSIWAWKLGGNWSITDSFRLRATQSRDVRAATLQERFDQTRGGVNVQDPANNNVTVTTASFSGGNPSVAPEEADTTTVGFVYQPVALDGFAMSVDWYRIDITDAIGQLTSQDVVSGCFRGDQLLCSFVQRRDNLPNGAIDRVDNLFINLANQLIEGVDLETSYRRNFSLLGGGAESVTWRFYATYLGENSIQNKGAVRDERVGQVANAFSLPKYKVTSNITYRNGPASVFLQGRWIDGGKLDRLRVESDTNIPNSISDNSVPSTFYTDLNLSYLIGEEDNLNVYANVTNLFDRAPVTSPSIIGRAGTTEFNTALYDVVGRRFVIGMDYKF